ncbi:PilZ domain-containing protein [Psychrobacillus sp. FJAT-51614]|uniref:PilZ domain-containing protein n=1 Tax=Psychrobacillus mangrovi TaxID=3117745 RepID=A0ABU8F5W9_9BACI
MLYKRNEYFRYTFEEPFEATFRLKKEASETSPEEISKKGKCLMIDISPNGVKMYSELFIAIDQLNHVELQFKIDETPIQIDGEFIWSHRKKVGFEYGVRLMGDEESEKLIISELKNRRKKELELKK